MTVGFLNEREFGQLVQEITARQEFEASAHSAFREAISRPAINTKDVLAMWVSVLGNQKGLFTTVAALECDPAGNTVVVAAASGGDQAWSHVASASGIVGLQESVRARKTFRCKISDADAPAELNDGYVLAWPIQTFGAPVSFAVATRAHETGLIRGMLDHAGARAAASLSVIRSAQERQRGIQQMAGRVSQMCSSSLVLARCRLEELASDPAVTVHSRALVERAIGDLDESLEGFERARLIGDGQRVDVETIDLGTFIGEIMSSLPQKVKRERHASLADSDSRFFVRASALALRYALRDLMLVTAIVSNWQLREVKAMLSPDRASVHIRVVGGKLGTMLNLKNGNLDNLLRSPDTYLAANDEYKVPRSIGLQLAYTVVADMKGSIKATVDASEELSFDVDLPLGS